MKRRSRWKLMWFSIFVFKLVSPLEADDENSQSGNAQKSIFAPRMDYNQWKPLGRGDPLKNDPTFDYVPPVLDHVHYWVDPETQNQHQAQAENGHRKTEILLLGVSSKKPATASNQNKPTVTANDRRDTVFENYPKYYQDKHANYYSHHSNQRVARPNYFPSMTSQIIPSLVSLANRVFDRSTFSKGQDSKVPYTVLMPPPMVTNPSGSVYQYSESPITQKPLSFTSAAPSNEVTVQESNLIYQSSSLGNQKDFEAVPSINWELPVTTEMNYAYQSKLQPPNPFARVRFSNRNLTNKILDASSSNSNINYVTPPPLKEDQVMFKGIVSDDNEIANSYVKIEKPEAQMDHRGVDSNVHIFTHAEAFRPSNNQQPVNMQMITDMETMKPPPIDHSPVYTRPTVPTSTTPSTVFVTTLHPTAFSRPVTETPSGFKLTKLTDFETTNLIGSSSFITNTFVTTPKEDTSTVIPTSPPDMLSEMTTLAPPTTTATEAVTTMRTLTTDPLFKHYRQPAEPLRGPMYLIIEGHSKVKTYKPAKQLNGIMVRESNEIPHFGKTIDYTIKHLHGFDNKEDLLGKADNLAKERQARNGNLRTLKHAVLTGLGAINFGKEEVDEMLRRSDADLQETEVVAGYEVVDTRDVTSEKYRKGIVEEARKMTR